MGSVTKYLFTANSFYRSSPRSRPGSGERAMFTIGSPPGSPHHENEYGCHCPIERSLSSPRTVKSNPSISHRSRSGSSPSPTNPLRTHSPLSRDLVTPPPGIRKSSTSIKVSTPPTLEPVIDRGESGHRQSYSLDKLPLKQQTKSKVRRVRCTTISNASDVPTEMKNSKKVIPYTNLYNLKQNKQVIMNEAQNNIDLVADAAIILQNQQNTDIRKSKSSPALISEAVRNMPVQKSEQVNSNLTTLLRQLAEENLQPNLLETLASPSFKLIETPQSPNFNIGDFTPPPPMFMASSPSSWQEKLNLAGQRRPSNSSITSCNKENRRKGSIERDNIIETNVIKTPLMSRNSSFEFRKSPCECGRNSSSNSPYGSLETPYQVALNRDLSLDPIPCHEPIGLPDEDSFYSQEHLIAIKEIQFLLDFSETILKLASDITLSMHIADLISEQTKNEFHLLPTKTGDKYAKILLTLETLRITSYALKFSQSQRKKGILEVTEKFKKGKCSSLYYGKLYFHFFFVVVVFSLQNV